MLSGVYPGNPRLVQLSKVSHDKSPYSQYRRESSQLHKGHLQNNYCYFKVKRLLFSEDMEQVKDVFSYHSCIIPYWESKECNRQK